jgi:hypothetical protein
MPGAGGGPAGADEGGGVRLGLVGGFAEVVGLDVGTSVGGPEGGPEGAGADSVPEAVELGVTCGTDSVGDSAGAEEVGGGPLGSCEPVEGAVLAVLPVLVPEEGLVPATGTPSPYFVIAWSLPSPVTETAVRPDGSLKYAIPLITCAVNVPGWPRTVIGRSRNRPVELS